MNQKSDSFTANEIFAQLFDEHIATVFARQLLFAKLFTAKEEPSINLEDESVTFSNGISFKIELLGTQLESDDTFIWAWSDENSIIFEKDSFTPPFKGKLLESALHIKEQGEKLGIMALCSPKVTLELSSIPLVPDEFNGDHIACLAAGLLNKVYWRDTRDEGIVYYLISSTPKEICGNFTVPHIINTLEQVTSYFATQNANMVLSFLEQQGFTGSWVEAPDLQNDDEFIEATGYVEGTSYFACRDNEQITASFDIDGALVELEAHGFEGEDQIEDAGITIDDFDIGDLMEQWESQRPNQNDGYDDDEFPPKIS